jgi:TRAP-type C4-dicarboxylate transport system permease small subunit
MSDNSDILIDHSLLSKSDQLFFKIESIFTLISGFIIFALVFLSVANVLGRWFFSFPVDGYIDWIEQSMAFFAFLGIAFVQRQGAHIRMEMLISKLHGRFLWVGELTSVFLMLFVTLVLIYGSFLHFLRAYQLGDSSLDIDLPTWPAKLVVPVALTLMAIRLLLQIWAYIIAIKNNSKVPVALPIIKDATKSAAEEAKTVMSKS